MALLQTDLANLNSVLRKVSLSDKVIAAATERQAFFDAHERTFSQEIESAERRAAAAKLTATENIAAGAFVGGSKTASAVLFLIPGFNSNYNNKSRRAGRVTNDLLFTSAVVGLPATAFSILDTMRIQVTGEINRCKAAKAGMLPAQIAAKRLQDLDDIERR